MTHASTQNELKNGLSNWLQTPQGRYILDFERAKIKGLVADIFGFNALQLGFAEYDFLHNNRIAFKQIIDPKEQGKVRCDFRELPFLSNSIDLVVLPHVFEFNENPHQILREVERILIPDGQIIMSGFNPFSLWGLKRRLTSKTQRKFPFNGQFMSIPRLKDWLQLLSLEPDRGVFGCYAPPLESDIWLKNWRFMESAGDRWWGFAGSVYIIRAVKRVRGMHLITPNWQRKSKLATVEVLSPMGKNLGKNLGKNSEPNCPEMTAKKEAKING